MGLILSHKSAHGTLSASFDSFPAVCQRNIDYKGGNMSVKVKGSLLVDYARLIRANKETDWKRWLGAEELEIISKQVLTASWYSYHTFRKLAWACFQGVAGGDLDLSKTFGRFMMKNLLQVYQTVLVPNNPLASFEKFGKFWQNFFKGEGMECTLVSSAEKSATYKITAPSDEKVMDKVDAFSDNFLDSVAAFAHQMGGMLMELVEQAGGQSPESGVASEGLVQYITVRWK